MIKKKMSDNNQHEKTKEDKILETMDKMLKLMQANMQQNTELLEKQDKLLNKIEIVAKTTKLSERAVELLKDRKLYTKSKLMSELGLSTKYWRGWKELLENLSNNSKINIHPGTGRCETILIYTNEETSLISMASRLFKSLKKGKSYNINTIKTLFNIDDAKAKKVLDEASRIFKGRIKRGVGGIFKKIY